MARMSEEAIARNRENVASYRQKLKDRAEQIVSDLEDPQALPTPNCDLDGERKEAEIILRAAAALQRRSAELHERIRLRLEKHSPARAQALSEAAPLLIQLKPF
ncbi:hypothetical protein [Paracoccus litorisediminis]|uniref:Uncharacterized protein n=1 Tax=Paracoccus litorisediminis TaxID=2006130 RepID=A0A844HMS6_9RHOB|nr:hypothetical protein [Paracoccus litorisediminis]MTH61176.1 hypothetical protein [Paracoccus litorisediminis]